MVVFRGQNEQFPSFYYIYSITERFSALLFVKIAVTARSVFIRHNYTKSDKSTYESHNHRNHNMLCLPNVSRETFGTYCRKVFHVKHYIRIFDAILPYSVDLHVFICYNSRVRL